MANFGKPDQRRCETGRFYQISYHQFINHLFTYPINAWIKSQRERGRLLWKHKRPHSCCAFHTVSCERFQPPACKSSFCRLTKLQTNEIIMIFFFLNCHFGNSLWIYKEMCVPVLSAALANLNWLWCFQFSAIKRWTDKYSNVWNTQQNLSHEVLNK